MDRWSRRWKAGEDNKDQLRKILDEVSAAPEPAQGQPGAVDRRLLRGLHQCESHRRRRHHAA